MGTELNGKCVQVVAPDPQPDEGEDERDDYPVLTRESILDASDLDMEYVSVPEWGGGVFVRNLTGVDRDRFENASTAARKRGVLDVKGLMASYVTWTACDAEGNPIFSEGDAQALNAKSARPLQRVFDAAQRINAMTAQDVDDLLGNSGSDPSDDSGTS